MAVQVAERWILARLRHETFFSLAALNARIGTLLAELNARPMRLYRASRRELLERLDQPALRPLPAEAFVHHEWKLGVRVNIDYHIELHGHSYSVPYAFVHEHVDARLTATTVEIFYRGQRLAAHRRSVVRGQHTTDPAHMPKAHQRHLEWTPSRPIDWGRIIAQRADIAYVARQLGHAKMTTTLLFYGHWFPKGDRRYVELMEDGGRPRLGAAAERAYDRRRRRRAARSRKPEQLFMAPLWHHKRIGRPG